MSLILKGPEGPGVTGNLGHGKEAKSAPEAEAEGRMCWAQPPPTASCRGSGWGPLGTSFSPGAPLALGVGPSPTPRIPACTSPAHPVELSLSCYLGC